MSLSSYQKHIYQDPGQFCPSPSALLHSTAVRGDKYLRKVEIGLSPSEFSKKKNEQMKRTSSYGITVSSESTATNARARDTRHVGRSGTSEETKRKGRRSFVPRRAGELEEFHHPCGCFVGKRPHGWMVCCCFAGHLPWSLGISESPSRHHVGIGDQEIMAILALATDLKDLRSRLGKMICCYSKKAQ